MTKWNWKRLNGNAPFWMFWDPTSGGVGGTIAVLVAVGCLFAIKVWVG